MMMMIIIIIIIYIIIVILVVIWLDYIYKHYYYYYDVRFVIMRYPNSGIGEVSEFDSQYQPQERNDPAILVKWSIFQHSTVHMIFLESTTYTYIYIHIPNMYPHVPWSKVAMSAPD
jgi:hypothetical protein